VKPKLCLIPSRSTRFTSSLGAISTSSFIISTVLSKKSVQVINSSLAQYRTSKRKILLSPPSFHLKPSLTKLLSKDGNIPSFPFFPQVNGTVAQLFQPCVLPACVPQGEEEEALLLLCCLRKLFLDPFDSGRFLPRLQSERRFHSFNMLRKVILLATFSTIVASQELKG